MPGRYFRREISWEAYGAALPLAWPPADQVDPPEAAYNIAPTQIAPIIRRIPEGDARPALIGQYELAGALWGLVPSWWSKPLKEKRFATHNARADGLEESNTFRGAFRHRRCLVPASGFYVWTGAAGAKTAFAVGVRDADWFCFAGLWDRAMIDGSEIDTFTIVTTLPNDVLAALDARAPVIIRPGDYDRWLDHGTRDVADLLEPLHTDEMRAWPVGPAVGDVRDQGPDLAADRA